MLSTTQLAQNIIDPPRSKSDVEKLTSGTASKRATPGLDAKPRQEVPDGAQGLSPAISAKQHQEATVGKLCPKASELDGDVLPQAAMDEGDNGAEGKRIAGSTPASPTSQKLYQEHAVEPDAKIHSEGSGECESGVPQSPTESGKRAGGELMEEPATKYQKRGGLRSSSRPINSKP